MTSSHTAGHPLLAAWDAPHSPVVEPLDEYNQRLLENVHPPTWRNPTPKERYHLVVIGAGTGGLVCAAAAASLGAKVALVERELMGGDCLNVGCVPSKAVIRAARAWHEAARASSTFGGPRVSEVGDFSAVMRRMRRLRAGLSRIDGAARFRELGVDVFLGTGRFISPQTVQVSAERLHFRRAVIATGARAAAPDIPGLAAAGYVTNETIFSLTELPRRMLVIGAGPIGCEMAQSFARFGSHVTVINRMSRILPREDDDAARLVEASMVRDGVVFKHDATIPAVERRGTERVVHVEFGGRRESLVGDLILVGVGRAPNIEGLGLEAAGVHYDHSGVTVDERLRTSNRRIYGVGDISSPHKFTHAADAQARIVIANALFFGRGRTPPLVMPWCTYTSPELAHVGLYQQEAQAAGHRVDTLTVPLHDVDRAVLDGEDEGLLRLHLRRGTDKILGATLVAEHAGDMLSEITLAMTAGVGLSTIGKTIHPYPTQAEVFRKAADAWRRRKLTPAAKRAFGLFFRIFS